MLMRRTFLLRDIIAHSLKKTQEILQRFYVK